MTTASWWTIANTAIGGIIVLLISRLFTRMDNFTKIKEEVIQMHAEQVAHNALDDTRFESHTIQLKEHHSWLGRIDRRLDYSDRREKTKEGR